MATRTTVYLEPRIYRALKFKSASTSKKLSEIINEALLISLKEDAIDLAVFDQRKREPTRPFEDVLKELKRDGLL